MAVPEQTDIAYLVSDAEGQLFVSGLSTVAAGNSSCLDDGMFTVTAAPAADTVATSVADTSSGGVNVGAIVGGVVAGISGLVLLVGLGAFLLHRCNRQKRQEKLKRNIKLLSYPASQKPRLEGIDKEGWVKMEDPSVNWEREEVFKVPQCAARFEQRVMA
ncbi:hypothetical protein CALVIDRAFT_534633 [Calocera viscosa TUFC12733]|uniref:Mid2 domain-containing protein n=1 Tax=Calocera viscosa (strain TUFC12733) TaxID=1330018 RepID=A0A167PTA1_CALVF|nr:hypothetical protein CALVIDRAFT_534633 [Calocera viscosa TUFC12733]